MRRRTLHRRHGQRLEPAGLDLLRDGGQVPATLPVVGSAVLAVYVPLPLSVSVWVYEKPPGPVTVKTRLPVSK